MNRMMLFPFSDKRNPLRCAIVGVTTAIVTVAGCAAITIGVVKATDYYDHAEAVKRDRAVLLAQIAAGRDKVDVLLKDPLIRRIACVEWRRK